MVRPRLRRTACAGCQAPLLERTLAARDWKSREAALAEAYLAVAALHRPAVFSARSSPRSGLIFGRPFTVINAEAIWEAIRAEIADPVLRALPVIGALDQVTDSTPVVEAPARARRMMAGLFDDGEPGAIEEA